MKSINYVFATLMFAFIGSYVHCQDAPDAIVNESIDSITILHESSKNIKLLSASTVRFATNASVYLQWEKQPDIYEYRVAYKAKTSNTWVEIQVSDDHMLLDNLPLDAEFIWIVIAPGFNSDIGVFSTHIQKEPIAVSEKLYNKLGKWFSEEIPNIALDNFIESLDLHKYEKLSFIQSYGYNNMPFRYSNIDAPLNAFFPLEANGNEVVKAFYHAGCGCRVITRGNLVVTPNAEILYDVYRIMPRYSQFIAHVSGDRTYVDRFESGAAKFISLRQNEGSGGVSFQMSNLQQAGNPTGVTTEASELRFMLACAENGSTNISPRCSCERPLTISAQYTTKLHVQAERRNCIWSKGAAAQAEDLAFLSVYNERTGSLSALAAGQFMLGRGCNSGWNPQFWIQLLNVVNPVIQVYVQNQDPIPTNNLPTPPQINQFINALQGLIGTPFMNRTGNCETVQDERTLVAKDTTIILRPNNPVRVGLYSAFYVRTRGYGCWRAEAGIASDYFLMGVVESQLTEDPECCADKFASYVVGSLSTPPNGDVNVQAVHRISDRLMQVGARLGTYGTWDDHQTTPFGVNLQGREFNLLRGRSCIRSHGLTMDDSNVNIFATAEDNGNISIELFPAITESLLNIKLKSKNPDFINISILNIYGRPVKNLFSGIVDSGESMLNYYLGSLPPGSYICHFSFGNKIINKLFIIQ